MSHQLIPTSRHPAWGPRKKTDSEKKEREWITESPDVDSQTTLTLGLDCSQRRERFWQIASGKEYTSFSHSPTELGPAKRNHRFEGSWALPGMITTLSVRQRKVLVVAVAVAQAYLCMLHTIRINPHSQLCLRQGWWPRRRGSCIWDCEAWTHSPLGLSQASRRGMAAQAAKAERSEAASAENTSAV